MFLYCVVRCVGGWQRCSESRDPGTVDWLAWSRCTPARRLSTVLYLYYVVLVLWCSCTVLYLYCVVRCVGGWERCSESGDPGTADWLAWSRCTPARRLSARYTTRSPSSRHLSPVRARTLQVRCQSNYAPPPLYTLVLLTQARSLRWWDLLSGQNDAELVAFWEEAEKKCACHWLR